MIVLIVVMIIFGAGMLPLIGAGIGKGINNFIEGVAEVEKEEPEKIEAKSGMVGMLFMPTKTRKPT